VVSILLEEETRWRHADAQAITSSALVAHTGAGGRRGVLGGGNGGSGTGSEGQKCYRCSQRGHIAVKCPAPQPTVLPENTAVAAFRRGLHWKVKEIMSQKENQPRTLEEFIQAAIQIDNVQNPNHFLLLESYLKLKQNILPP
jgi:hypothetical protein